MREKKVQNQNNVRVQTSSMGEKRETFNILLFGGGGGLMGYMICIESCMDRKQFYILSQNTRIRNIQ